LNIENRALVLDLLEWVNAKPRTYADTIEAWRTSCPRLSIWEDALDLGLVTCRRGGNAERTVAVTAVGRALLEAERPAASVPMR